MFCWDSRLSVHEMNEKLWFGGTVGYGDSCMEFFLPHFKLIRPPARPYDAAGSVRLHWWRHWLLLHGWTRTKSIFGWSNDWTTLLLLRKALSTFHFQLCGLSKQYVLHCKLNWAIRLKKLSKCWEYLIMGTFGYTHFVLQESKNPQNMLFRAKNGMKLCKTVEHWKTVSSKTFLLKM